MKTVKFLTLGCKVNQYDTQQIRESFIGAGLSELDNGSSADVYVINTCTVTQRADAESFNLIRRARRENPESKIVVTGCLAEADKDTLERMGGINLIVKNNDKQKIVSLLNGANGANGLSGHKALGITNFKGHTRAFLKIQDGCNNFCSYCKVPMVRGPSRSRGLKEIISEAEGLVKNGFKEVVLTGICLGAYGRDLKAGGTIAGVVRELEKIEGLLRIRLSSIEANDISQELIDRMSVSKKLCRYLHIPLQSGDNEILKRMNRSYTSEDYLSLVNRIAKSVPDAAISTDLMAGFPGESEENFQSTVKLIREIGPLKSHIFPYSQREGTAAAGFKERCSADIIKQRLASLKSITESLAREYKNKFLSRVMDVLVEGNQRDKPDLFEGYTGNYIKVQVKLDKGLSNQIIPVKLKSINEHGVVEGEAE